MTRGWPFYPPDYERDTEHLKGATEHGCYFLLLKHYWTHGGLPDDDNQLRKIVGLPGPQWQKLKPTLQTFFHDGWKHKRVDRDLNKARAFSQRQKRRAQARWENNTGDNKRGKTRVMESGHLANKPLRTLNTAMPPAMPYAMPILKQDRILSIAARDTDGVDKSGQPSKASASPKHHNKPELNRARHAWENTLRLKLGPPGFADAAELLLANPAVMDQATEAEMEQPGSGWEVAIKGLREILQGEAVR